MSGEVSNRSRYAHNPIKEWTKKLNAKIRVLRVYSLHPMTTHSMTTHSPNLHPLIVHSLSTLCPLIVHLLSTHCLLIVHSLSIHCPFIVHSLFTHRPLIVHWLSIHCPLIVHSLSTHCPVVFLLSTHCLIIFHSLSHRCHKRITEQAQNLATGQDGLWQPVKIRDGKWDGMGQSICFSMISRFRTSRHGLSQDVPSLVNATMHHLFILYHPLVISSPFPLLIINSPTRIKLIPWYRKCNQNAVQT